jgi:L-cysteine/cystine lyase
MAVGTAIESKVETLRAQLPAVLTTGYFNTGSNGPIPTAAYEAADAAARRELEQGRIVPGTYEGNFARNRQVAAFAAGIFGAHPNEIALTHSTCEGLNTALMGIAWNRGDEIVTTSEEHPGLLKPLALLGHRFGVVTRIAALDDGSGDVVGAIAARVTSATRVIALSHVLWSTGAVVPLREIADFARDNELMVIVDGAQSGGQLPVDLHALGVDAYAMAGQKWLCGPEATGLLYVRQDRFSDIHPTYVRYGQSDTSGFYVPPTGASRYEIGEFYQPAIAAQEAALRWLRDEVGMEWAFARTATLAADFRERLTRIPRVAVVTPASAMAGLVNFTVEGMRCQDVASTLYERGYTIRYVEYAPCTKSARASVAWWNTEEEVAGLADAIADLARELR